MNLILLGPPGAGKGTQAELIVNKLNIPHISTGDIFRAALKTATPLGLKAKEYMDQGQLVPDEIVIGIVNERLLQSDCRKGFLLDGFPRTLPQAEALEVSLNEMGRKITAVINIETDFQVIIKRLTGRRVCRNCGALYHLVTKQPRVADVCDHCGGQIYQRDDDLPETVSKRLDVYKFQTEPLIKFYQEKGIMLSFDGETAIPILFEQICKALGV